jgi:proline-specific peptidase
MTQLSDGSIAHPPGRHVEVRGHRLWVETEGRGEPLLMLAGLGPAGSHVIFHPFFSALSDAFQLIYVDLYGRGRSDMPADLREVTFADDVADVAALITALDVGPVHVYGFSYGGLLGQALALGHRDAIRSLVLANSLHSPEMWQLNHENINRELANQYPETWEQIIRLHAEGVPSTDPRMRNLFAVGSALVRFYDPANAARIPSEPGSRNLELYPIFCGADVDFTVGGQVARIPDFRPRLKEIEVPLMVLAGRYDRALYPALQRQFLDGTRAEFRILERSGSFGHIEETDVVLGMVREFCADATPPVENG